MQLLRLNWPSRALRVAVIVGLVWGCGDKGTTAPPTPVPTKIDVSATTLTLDGVGATQQLTASVKDQTGAAISGAAITWSTSAAAVATVSDAGVVAAVAKGTATVTAASGSLTGTAAITVNQTPTTLSKVSGDAQTGAAGTALTNPLVVKVSDPKGSGISGVAVTFAITAGGGSLGTASATTSADGTASSTWTLGTTAGVIQTVSASTTGVTGTADFAATAATGAAAKLVLVSGNNQTGPINFALSSPAVVKVTDANDNPVATTTVTFAVTGGGGSVTPLTMASGSNGQAQTSWTLGGTLGAQTMTASATGLTGSPVTFTATGSNLGISGIVQDTLTEGASITINGAGFDATPANNTVLIDGVAGTVTAASVNQLSVTVPAFDCKPARDGNTTVGVGGGTSNAVTKRIHPASFVNLAVGAQQIIQNTANFCLQFRPNPGGGDAYMVGVGAAVESNSQTFGVTISTGTGAASAPPMFPVSALPLRTLLPAQGTQAIDPEVARMWRGQHEFEARRREWERTELPALLRSGAALRPGAAQSPVFPGQKAAQVSVGDVLSLKVLTGGSVCGSSTTISGKVKAIGTAGIWVTDVANPPQDTITDAVIQAYSDTFDTKIYAGDTTYFGVPSDIDGNGRVIVVLTWQVNKAPPGNVAGFVSSGDLLAPGACPPSNQGEYFYGAVPDPSNVAGTGLRTKANVLYQMPSLIAHEFTHNIQVSRRIIIAGSNTTMNSWEAEGQAMLAQEVVGHKVLGNLTGQNYGSTPLFNGQAWYLQAFNQLAEYFGGDFNNRPVKIANAPEQCTLFGSGLAGGQGPCAGDSFYGASWSFQRYISDRFGPTYTGGEIKMNHDIISKNPTLAGRANWEAMLGVGFDSLFAQWGAMLALDDQVGGLTAVQTLPSWNLPSTTNLLVVNFGAAFALAPTNRSFTAFSDNHTIRGGGTSFTKLSQAGARPALAVKVRDQSGNALGAGMKAQLWVTRTQ
jgi:hypothetical protein